ARRRRRRLAGGHRHRARRRVSRRATVLTLAKRIGAAATTVDPAEASTRTEAVDWFPDHAPHSNRRAVRVIRRANRRRARQERGPRCGGVVPGPIPLSPVAAAAFAGSESLGPTDRYDDRLL